MADFARVQPRGATAAKWTTTNEILRAGEVGYETDTGLTKLGDGATAWNDLPYVNTGVTQADVDTTVSDALSTHTNALDPHPQYARLVGDDATSERIWIATGTLPAIGAGGAQEGDHCFFKA